MAENSPRMPVQGQPFEVEWSIFTAPDGARVAVPRSPLMKRLRAIVGEDFFAQAPLVPIKRFMEALFFAGPGCLLIALYLPSGGGLLIWLGILCLALASPYWFAPHWLCRHYLQYRGFELTGRVQATQPEEALAKAG